MSCTIFDKHVYLLINDVRSTSLDNKLDDASSTSLVMEFFYAWARLPVEMEMSHISFSGSLLDFLVDCASKLLNTVVKINSCLPAGVPWL